jgi:vacuole morphology and inheritance protein 14
MDTENLLNIFLKEVKSIARVKLEVKKRQLQFERNKEQKVKDGETRSENEQNESNIKDMGKLDISDSISIQSNSTTIIHSQRDETDVNDAEEHQNIVDTTDKKEDKEDGNEEEDLFLTGQNIFIDYPTIIEILLSFLRHQETREIKCVDLSNEPHEIYTQIQFISLKWLHEILSISPSGFLKYLPLCISVIMQNLAIIDHDKDYELQQQFLSFNSELKQFIIRINESSDILDTEELEIHGLTNELKQEFIENYLNLTIDQIIKDYLNNRSESGKIASLEWLIFLYENYSTNFLQIIAESEFDLSELLKPSNNVGNDVILKVLQLLSKISETNDEFFRDFIHKLVRFIHQQDSSNRSKTEFVIRKLCVTLDAERIFKVLSEVLLDIDDLEFIDSMIVMLNNILLTAHELAGFRKKLKSLDIYKTEDWSLLSTLFQCWCHNAPSALSLCLLTSYYELAYLIIKNISELEVTYRLLVQIDILIQLLESPIFLKLRLQLLEPERNPYLYKTLYGLLMILPQSTTFNTLKNRLDSTSNLLNSSTTNMGPPSVIPTPITPSVSGTTPVTPGTNNQLSTRKKRIYEMLDRFVKVHNEHEEYTLERQSKDIEDARSERLVSHALSISERKDYFQVEPQEGIRTKKPVPRINR